MWKVGGPIQFANQSALISTAAGELGVDKEIGFYQTINMLFDRSA